MVEYVEHTLQPIYDEHSELLILGTMPSPKSREAQFYYAHPRNRFWRLLSELFEEPLPVDNSQRRDLLLRHHIALWDVLHSCMIERADDASIREPVPNDIAGLLAKTSIRSVATTGSKAYALYQKYCRRQVGLDAIALPSTSPANQRFYRYSDLKREYAVILSLVHVG